MFDSATKQLIAVTDAITIEVTGEILQRSQPLMRDDTLTIRASHVSATPWDPSGNLQPTTHYLQLIMNTSKEYEYSTMSNIRIADHSNSNEYSYSFGDSLVLDSYPFAHHKGKLSTIWFSVDLHNLQPEQEKPFNFTWLGHLYTGSVKFTAGYQPVLKIDNPDRLVRMTN